MSWLYSQALVAAFSEATCSDGEQSAQLSVMPTARRFWRSDKPMECSRFSQFGRTLNLLTASRGAELLISYLAAFPVRTSASPETMTESKASAAGCGARWRESFARFDRDSSGWKTAQRSLLGDSESFSATWPVSGSMQSGVCYQQPPPVLIIFASGSGCSPLVPARSYATPTASMHKGWSPNHNRAESDDRLDYTIEREARAAGQSGRLNPAWVEWLIGWPIGWTGLQPLETDKFREWRLLHSAF
jgi:hypothetical protein